MGKREGDEGLRYYKMHRTDEIKERWKNYFHKQYNENSIRGIGPANTSLLRDILYCRKIAESDVKSALKEVGIWKSLGPGDIRLKFWSVWL